MWRSGMGKIILLTTTVLILIVDIRHVSANVTRQQLVGDIRLKTADTIGNVGSNSSIAIHPDGRPFIAYEDLSNNRLKLYVCNDAVCSSGQSQTLDINATEPSLAIRNDGRLLIAARQDTTGMGDYQLSLFDCLDTQCSNPQVRMLESLQPSSFGPTSLLIRSDGRPVIAFFRDQEGALSNLLKLYSCLNTDCDQGDSIVINSEVQISRHNVMVLRPDAVSQTDLPVFAYQKDSDMVVFACTDEHCSSGIETPTMSGPFSGIPTIAMRNSGLPSIAYTLGAAALKLYDCTNADCTSGFERNIGQARSGQSGITIRPDNRPIVVHSSRNLFDDGLRIYNCADPQCISGETINPDNTSEAANFINAATCQNGLPIISFQRGGVEDLVLLTCELPPPIFQNGFETQIAP